MGKNITNKVVTTNNSVPLPELLVSAPKLPQKAKYTTKSSNVSYRLGDKTKFTTSDRLNDIFKRDYDSMSNLHPDAAKLLVEGRYNVKYLNDPLQTMVPTRATQDSINDLAGVKKYNIGAAGILDMIGGASDMFIGSPNNKTSNTATAISATAKGAAMGAKLGSIAGPWGTAIGAVGGGALSLAQSLDQIKEMNFQDRMAKAKQSAASNVSINNGINAQMQADYAVDNRSSNRVSGFNKGKSGLQPSKTNALVANEEVIRDGNNGDLIKVGGKYNPLNPDTVPANINDADSVYQASSRYVIPGGAYTPSKVMSIAADYQKKSDKILEMKGAGKLRTDTANLNLANIQKQANLLDMNTMNINKYIENENNIKKYNKGKVSAAVSKINDTEALGGANPMDVMKGGFGAISSTLTDLAKLAPVFSNLTDNKPEIETPIFDSFINPIQRYNVAEPLRESANQRSIARYNQSVSKQGGSRSFGAEIYSKGIDQISSIMGQADTANNTYASQYADRFNQNAAARSAELKRIADINARNRAAANTIKKTGLSQLSEYAQTNELMRNQKSRDNMKMDIFSMYADSMDPAFLKKLEELYTKNQRNG